jgi:hypothetical protein
MLQVLAYELDECLLRVAVEQISGHHGAPSRRTVRTRCFELDMLSGEARERLARAPLRGPCRARPARSALSPSPRPHHGSVR